jgi:hypothetical protein
MFPMFFVIEFQPSERGSPAFRIGRARPVMAYGAGGCQNKKTRREPGSETP